MLFAAGALVLFGAVAVATIGIQREWQTALWFFPLAFLGLSSAFLWAAAYKNVADQG
jgi:uncharacterized membrane protein